eukprot:TRINITY_DN33986_c0_g1_i1.p1 TRINITY_DN33986_c0_g1~~TRINITY_DN33986_c0_g1_i1.p1  ORF type:complete len:157 (+),score=30.23 TRINITY_DN33986_c0_g1_i1:73-543(+)
MFKAAALVSTLAVATATNSSVLTESDITISCSPCGGLDAWECPASAANGETFHMKSSGTLTAEVDSDSYYTVTVRAFGLTVQQTTMPACGIQSFDLLSGAGLVTTNLYDTCPKTGAFESEAQMSITANAAGTYEADFRIYGKSNALVGCLDVVMVV